jgi:hypothetical protein
VQIGQRHVEAVLALRSLLREAVDRLALDRTRAHAVMHRRASSRDVPPMLRGCALGFLWSTSYFTEENAAESLATAVVKSSAEPQRVGDFLAGLFALAREEVAAAPALLAAIDTVVAGMSDGEFLVAVPALRLAFSFFPPMEKERLAMRLLERHGGDATQVRSFLSLTTSANTVMDGLALEAKVTEIARRYGLDDPEEPS